MNETDPQRHETPGPLGQEPSHRTADPSRESTSPEREASEPTTAQQPVLQQAGAPASPWQPPSPAADQPTSAQPTSGYPSYPGQQQPPYPPQYTGQYGQQYGGPQYGPQPADPQAPWAAPVGAPPKQPGSGRGRKIFVTGAAALLIALAGGGVGAATVMALDNDNGSTVTSGGPNINRVVDRSSLSAIATAVQDSVVSIETGSGEGSGVILSADGFVLTNNHVVASAQGDTVTVNFADGKTAEATIVGTDPRTDLAVIKANGVSGLKAANFGKSADMQVGDTVLALGSPLGLEGSVTSGIISAKDRTIRSAGEEQDPQSPFGQQQQQQQAVNTMSGLLQTDAPINPGNSGGALVNTDAQVIGINTAIATSGSNGSIGLGFAIPSDKAIQVANALRNGEKVSHPALGVNVAAAENGGALVTNVQEGSAAANAGIEQGDVITSANGQPVNDSDDLVAVIQAGKVGDQISIDVTRDGANRTVTATLAEMK